MLPCQPATSTLIINKAHLRASLSWQVVVVPKKANWDLRRDIADKLAFTERRTQVQVGFDHLILSTNQPLCALHYARWIYAPYLGSPDLTLITTQSNPPNIAGSNDKADE
jgi:hypothetical protein